MPGKLSVLFIVIQVTEIIYCLNMDDSCSTYDIKFNEQNLSGVGMIQKFKFSFGRSTA